MKKIAIIDPASYTLPYDYYYIIELSNYYTIDFYYSSTQFNYSYIESLKPYPNIHLMEYPITGKNKLIGLINYCRMLAHINRVQNSYSSIHFFWSIFFPLEWYYFRLFRDKLLFTFHNDVPHNKHINTYRPYQIIHNLTKTSIFVSQFTKERFEKNYSITQPTLLIQHGVLPISSNDTTLQTISEVSTKNIPLVFWGLVRDYKGVDLFLNDGIKEEITIIGRWDKSLYPLKKQLSERNNLTIHDKFLENDEILELMGSANIVLLPYKNATQSGIAYTLIEYCKVFVCSKIGETYEFLKQNGLEELSFDSTSIADFHRAIAFARENYNPIQKQLNAIRQSYKWETIIKNTKDVYE